MITHNHKISLEGEGHENHHLKPGNLVLKVVVLEHEIFQREGTNLMVQLNMSIKEAKLGFQRNITHLNGTRFVIIREGITPPGLRLRVFNAGMPCYNGKRIFNDEGRKKKQRKQTIDENKDDCYGDMIISFAIHIPPNIRKHNPLVFENLLSMGKITTDDIENASYTLFDD